MRRAFIAAAVLAFAATPSAHAAPVGAGTTCGFLAVWNQTLIGFEYHGLLVGVAAAADPETLPLPLVAVRCEVTVNDIVPGNGGGTSVGLGAAVLLDDAVFPSDDADVDVCTTIAVNGNVEHEACIDATLTEVPPQELCDLLPVLCDTVGQATFLYVLPQPVVL